MGTGGKYVVTYRTCILTVCSVKRKKTTVRHKSFPSRNRFLVQKLILNHKLAAVLSIAVIKLFYIEIKRKRIC